MAEYIDREKIFPNGVFYVSAENPESSLTELINRICNLPTADVVPKSEVEKLTVELDAMRGAANSYKIHYNSIAREIFEEIEDCMKDFEDDDDGYLLKKCEFEFFMRELKKKYTEEKK